MLRAIIRWPWKPPRRRNGCSGPYPAYLIRSTITFTGRVSKIITHKSALYSWGTRHHPLISSKPCTGRVVASFPRYAQAESSQLKQNQ
jgi:hypothetical protein